MHSLATRGEKEEESRIEILKRVANQRLGHPFDIHFIHQDDHKTVALIPQLAKSKVCTIK